jgi:hypothetical protein
VGSRVLCFVRVHGCVVLVRVAAGDVVVRSCELKRRGVLALVAWLCTRTGKCCVGLLGEELWVRVEAGPSEILMRVSRVRAVNRGCAVNILRCLGSSCHLALSE